ncbi:MAG: epimerase [Acidobacteria bacterium]|nr:MAG: epimerase [Acidobacteriota bacterium]
MNRGVQVVTGGAGFIGSELVRQLAATGAPVVVIDNLMNGKRENLADVAGRVTLLEEDVRRVASYASVLREADVVYHLACLGVRHSVHSPVENHDVNATGTLRLLEASRAAGVPKFVYVSSSEVYGTAKWVPMTEDHPTFPCTVYGGAKLAGEAYTRAFNRTYAYPTVVVRPFNTYGPRSHHEGDSGEVIPKFLLRCLAGKPMVIFGEGTQTRDFTYVSDSARGIILAGTTASAVGRTINLGSGFELSINDLAKTVAEIAGRPDTPIQHDEPRPGDVLRLYADMSQARSLMGYDVRVPLAEGIRQLLDWYRAQELSPEELLRNEIVRNWDVKAATP